MSLELDRIIAEKVMGWPVWTIDQLNRGTGPDDLPKRNWIEECGRVYRGYGDQWNPSTDLNACFEAQDRFATQWDKGGWLFVAALTEVCKTHVSIAPDGLRRDTHNATAEQRCRAMLAAIEAANQQAGDLATVEPSHSSPPIGEKE